MEEHEFRRLLDKYLNGESTPQEREFMEKLLDKTHEQNKHEPDLDFKGEVRQRIWSKIQSKTIESEALTQQAENKPEKLKTGFFSALTIYKVAAILAGIAIATVGLWVSFKDSKNEQLVYADEKIILRSGDSAFEIQDGEFGQLKNEQGNPIATQQGDVIVYNQSDAVTSLVYNEIEVPNGKQIELILSDSTTVHLNSNSVFKFPVNFLKGQDRSVFLTGEAYFEVAKDASRPFLVDVDEMRVSVLGTHFNVSSYAGSISNTVLLEGSVTIQERRDNVLAGEVQKLTPGQKGSLVSGVIEVNDVDVDNYVGWMYGTMNFDNESFAEIVKKIERRYNVKIEVKNDTLTALRFKGKFREETILDLLNTFKESAGFSYTISNNTVIIK